MTITISGRTGEGKTCVANIVRNALSSYGFPVQMGKVPFIHHEIASQFIERVEIAIVEESTCGEKEKE